MGHGVVIITTCTVTPNAAYPKYAAVIVVSISIITSIMLQLTYLRVYEFTHGCAYYAPAYLTVCLVRRRQLMACKVCMLDACTRCQCSMRLCPRYTMDGWVGLLRIAYAPAEL